MTLTSPRFVCSVEHPAQKMACRALAFALVLAVGLAANMATAWPDKPCPVPPLATNFTLERYLGVWYEIGKVSVPAPAHDLSSTLALTCDTLLLPQLSPDPDGGRGLL